MGSNGIVLGLLGSPNREGRTNQLVAASRTAESLVEITRVYEAGVKAFDGK